MRAKSPQLRLTLCDPTDCSPPDSSVHGILQARILEWVAMPSSRKPGSPRITLLLRTLQLLPNSLRVPADLMYWPLRSQGSGIISILTPRWPPAVPTSFLGLPVPAASTHELHTQALWSEMHSPSCHPPRSCWLTCCLPSSLSIFTEMSPSE